MRRKLGELLKSVLLKSRYGTPISYSASIVATERLTDTLGMAFLAALGLSLYPVGLPALALIVGGMVAGIALMQSSALDEYWLQVLARAPLVGKFAPLAQNLYASAYRMLRWRPLMITLALSIAAWFGECLAFFFVLLGFGLAPTPALLLQTNFIYAAASLFGAITLLPGGLGATEGSMASLAQLLIGVNATVAAAATLLVRVCTLWFAIVLGGIALLVFGLPQENTSSDSTLVVD